MMWAVLGLLVTALTVESYIIRDQHERLQHGRQLKIYLPKSTGSLEFIPADDPRQTLVYWDKHKFGRPMRGTVSGSGNDRRWYIERVTFDDQGTYTQKDFWGKEMSTLLVAVSSKSNFLKCVPGRSLYIPLEGIREEDATLTFSGENGNFTLVKDGARVSQDLFEYFDRVRTHSKNIEILGVNVSDVGHYRLMDRKNRLVSVTRMDLTDHDDSAGGNPLLALLLLLGIPAGICCCCRKKIFKSKSTTAHTVQASPGAVVLPPSGPAGPCPPYNQPQPGGGYYPPQGTDLGPAIHPPPAAPGPGPWTGPPPSPGFNPAYPPPNPAYPPAGAPQWNGPPPAAGPYPGAYPPGPTAPMGYAPAPVMYSEPPPKEEIKMENMSSAPTDPLLTQPEKTSPEAPAVPPVAPASKDTLHSTDGAATFDIGKSSTNFL